MVDNNKIKETISKNVSSVFAELIDNEIKVNRNNGLPFYEKDIIKKIGISKSAFTNYKNGNDGKGVNAKPKLPDLVSLYKMHNYFNVPYSYLLGETKTKDIDNIVNGIKLGLDDNSICKLQTLKKDNDNLSIIKLLLINSIINNDELLENLSLILSSMFEMKCLEEECDNLNLKKINEYIKYSEYKTFDMLVKSLENNIEISKLSLNRQYRDILVKLKNQREWLSVDVKIHNEKV